MKYELKEKILKIEIDSLFFDTIQDFFNELIPSKKIQHLLIQNKWITMDGNPVKRETEIAGLYLEINLYPEVYDYVETELKAEIVYEDAFIVVVNKPKGILVHSDGKDEITLTDIVEGLYVDKPYVCVQPLHRLDKETSGMVVYSKSIITQPLFDKLMSEKQIRRNYLAFVAGRFEPNKTMVIDKPIGKDRHNSNKRVIFKGGQPALTKVKGLVTKNNISILRCSLDTGRTHQIRLHLSSIGYPILNDDIYGVPSGRLKRMGLVANELEMYHPFMEDRLNIEVDLPKDMSILFNELV